MTRYLLILTTVVFSASLYAGPYISDSLETSDSPHRGTELQNRIEVGYDYRNTWEFYLYHESDPRNGLKGNGYVGETENGVGIRLQYEWD